MKARPFIMFHGHDYLPGCALQRRRPWRGGADRGEQMSDLTNNAAEAMATARSIAAPLFRHFLLLESIIHETRP